MWQTYLQPTTTQEALQLLAQLGAQARVVAGGTDLVVELRRGVRPTSTVVDISRLRELKYVREQDGQILLGALATHNDVLASPLCRSRALPLAQACAEVGAPQIRTRGTIAGNLVTASPANDTITPLMALGAEVLLVSSAGQRVVPLRDFYQGVRRTVLRPDELLLEIRVPALGPDQRGVFSKLGLRRAQAIAVINVAAVVRLEGRQVVEARVALGCVAPTILLATEAERYLQGRELDANTCAQAGQLAAAQVTPIDDVRGSARYRHGVVARLVSAALQSLAGEPQTQQPPARPVLLETSPQQVAAPAEPFTGQIQTLINGQPYTLAHAAGKTLLDALREDAGLTGTKEGCAEGECGACTVWIDNQAVMACLVPAAQAHQASVTTVEGLASGDTLHPVQQAFIAHGAVQCGYCTPGMLMAAAKLLEEHQAPDEQQVKVAISGNICRCTGYHSILKAVAHAGGER